MFVAFWHSTNPFLCFWIMHSLYKTNSTCMLSLSFSFRSFVHTSCNAVYKIGLSDHSGFITGKSGGTYRQRGGNKCLQWGLRCTGRTEPHDIKSQNTCQCHEVGLWVAKPTFQNVSVHVSSMKPFPQARGWSFMFSKHSQCRIGEWARRAPVRSVNAPNVTTLLRLRRHVVTSLHRRHTRCSVSILSCCWVTARPHSSVARVWNRFSNNDTMIHWGWNMPAGLRCADESSQRLFQPHILERKWFDSTGGAVKRRTWTPDVWLVPV